MARGSEALRIVMGGKARVGLLLGTAILIGLVGCSDGREGDFGEGIATGAPPSAAMEAEAPAPVAEEISPPDAPLDDALASRGQELFTSKGCVGCHMIESPGTLSGPHLSGVATRRDWPWIRAMVMQTDSMLNNDPIAQELLAQYTIRMVPPPVTEGEVRALYEYFRTYPDPIQ